MSFPKIQQISMDGPNVNLKLLKDLKSDMFDQDDAQLLATGSCGLHIVHNAFRAAMASTEWELEKFLKAAYNIFKDSPARREDYVAVTGTTVLPLKFCGHRWLENVPVVERLITIMKELKMYVEKSQVDKCMRRRVKDNHSFDTLVVFLSGSKSDLTLARLHFFVAIAKPLNNFLTLFQADKPLMPFLADEICSILEKITQRFIKPSVLHSESIENVDVDDHENHFAVSSVDIGIAAKSKMSSSEFSNTDRQRFVKSCVEGLKTLFNRLVDKSVLFEDNVRI